MLPATFAYAELIEGRARLFLALINATNQSRKYNHQAEFLGRE